MSDKLDETLTTLVAVALQNYYNEVVDRINNAPKDEQPNKTDVLLAMSLLVVISDLTGE